MRLLLLMVAHSILLCCSAGAIIAIAFIHNLLRRHPSCSVLVHRPAAKSQAHTSTMPAAQNSMQPLSDRSGQATQNGHATANAQNGVQSNPPGKPLASPSVAANPHAQQNGVPAYAVATSSDSDSDADDDKSSSEAAAEQAAATRVPAAKADRGNQSATNGLAEGSVGEDVYDDTELDPAKSRAIESSLWEIDSLRQHYYHTVRTANLHSSGVLGHWFVHAYSNAHRTCTLYMHNKNCVFCFLGTCWQKRSLCQPLSA